MYELHAAVRTLAVLGQNVVGLVTQKTTTVGTYIVVLELMAEFLALLRNLGRIPVCLDEENNRGNDGDSIESDVPYASAASGDTQGNGHHRDESCRRAERIELALIYL